MNACHLVKGFDMGFVEFLVLAMMLQLSVIIVLIVFLFGEGV